MKVVNSRIVGIVRIDDGGAAEWFEVPQGSSVATRFRLPLRRFHCGRQGRPTTSISADCHRLRMELNRLYETQLDSMSA